MTRDATQISIERFRRSMAHAAIRLIRDKDGVEIEMILSVMATIGVAMMFNVLTKEIGPISEEAFIELFSEFAGIVARGEHIVQTHEIQGSDSLRRN